MPPWPRRRPTRWLRHEHRERSDRGVRNTRSGPVADAVPQPAAGPAPGGRRRLLADISPRPAHDPATDEPIDAGEPGEAGDTVTGGERHLAAAPETADRTTSTDPPAGEVAAPSPARRPTRDTAASAGDRSTTTRARRAPAANRGRAPRSTTSSDLDPTTSYQVPVYVHPGVRNAATDRRKTDKLTNAEIAFDALDEVQHRLTALIRDRRLQARPDSSLFPGRVRRGRLAGGGAAAAVGDARRVLWGFRATGAELEIIDRLVADTGAESRSELVAVALEETLLQ